MKKLALAVFAGFLLSTSCFDATSDYTKVTINLGPLAPPAGISRLHVGVFAGIVSDSTLLMKQTYTPGSYLLLVVPTGRMRVFLIWAENTSGEASYYGQSLPMDMDGEGRNFVPMEMYKFLDPVVPTNGLNFYSVQGLYYRWNSIPGATTYEIIYDDNGQPAVSSVFSTVPSSVTRFTPPGTPASGAYSVRAYSSVFNLTSVSSERVPF